MGERVVVVGASMGGLRAAENVRKAGYAGEVLVIGAEMHMPYNRPPLSKVALAKEPESDTLAFRVPRAANDVIWRLGATVVSSDLDRRVVVLDDGEIIGWEGLVIATGLRPRRLTLPGPDAGRHVLRTIEDARELRAVMVPGARMVIVGAGFIGCEVASTARGLGVEVDVVAPEVVPLERPLHQQLGATLQAMHERHGVRFHLGVLPVELRGQDRISSVMLSDGTELQADVLVESVGCTPNVEWLEGNGLDLSDGLLCDNRLRVEERLDIVACGDVARFPNPLFDQVPRRVEHWTMVTATAKRAGRTLGTQLTGGPVGDECFAPVPSFWSDQYDVRIQSFGAVGLGGDDVRVLEGALEGEAAFGYHREGNLVGVVMIGMANRHRYYHDLIASLVPA